MLADWLRAGIAAGRITTKYPKSSASLRQLHKSWQTVPKVMDLCSKVDCSCAEYCPTAAICFEEVLDANQRQVREVHLDQGACIGCGRCVGHCPDVFAWTRDVDWVATKRADLVSQSLEVSQHA